MPTADDLNVERAERDLDEGLEHTRARLRASVKNPFLEKPFEAAVFGAVHTIQLKSRFREDVRFLLSLAHRVAKGEDPRRLAEENIAQAIRMRELALVVRVKDPAFPPLLARDIDLMAKRLPDLARMATVPEPRDYEDVVRRAFPEKAEVEALVNGNHEHVLWVVRHFEQNPHLLRIPHAWVPRLASLAREIVDWQTARVLAAVQDIYA